MPSRRRCRPNRRLALVVACVSTGAASALAGLFVLSLVASWPLAQDAANRAMALRFLGGALVLVGIVAAALITRALTLPRPAAGEVRRPPRGTG